MLDAPEGHWHVIRCNDAVEADAFVRALQRFLAGPRGQAFLARRPAVEVWSAPMAPGPVDLFLSADALAATIAAFPSSPAKRTIARDDLPRDCTCVISGGLRQG